MLVRARPLLGTLVEIRCDAADAHSGAAHRALQSAFATITTVQCLMSFQSPDSELSLLNCRAHREAVTVHRWTWRVLRACAELHRASDGLFDPALAALRLVARGALPQPPGPVPSPEASFADVLFRSGQRIQFRRPLWLGLGGIAQGFAVDLAVATLRSRGVRCAVVNAGGDLRVIGAEPVEIRLRAPDQPALTCASGWLPNGD